MKPININTLDLNLLKMFLAVSETRSVSLAAEQLGLSQPAASNALTRLRHALGDPLFVRTRHGMSPTPFAEAILVTVEPPLKIIFEALTNQPRFDPATSARSFQLSLSGLGEAVILPRLAERVFREAPQSRIRNASVPARDLADALDRGDVDLAIGMIDVKARGIRSRTLFRESYVAVSDVGYVGQILTIKDLKSERLIVSAPVATYASNLSDILVRNGLSDNIALQLSNFGALPDLLRNTDLIAILPRQYALRLEATGQAKVLAVEITPQNTNVKLVWSATREGDPAIGWLKDIIFSLFQAV